MQKAIDFHDGAKPRSVYEERGFTSREDYLGHLAAVYSVSFDIVSGLAFMLGEEEDFDGLVSSLQAIAGKGYCE